MTADGDGMVCNLLILAGSLLTKVAAPLKTTRPMPMASFSVLCLKRPLPRLALQRAGSLQYLRSPPMDRTLDGP